MKIQVLNRIKKVTGQTIAHYEQFLLLSQCFQMSSAVDCFMMPLHVGKGYVLPECYHLKYLCNKLHYYYTFSCPD